MKFDTKANDPVNPAATRAPGHVIDEQPTRPPHPLDGWHPTSTGDPSALHPWLDTDGSVPLYDKNTRKDADETKLDGGVFGVSGKAATEGMRDITRLPPKQQGAAVAKLSDEQFKNLLTRVPEDKREELATLVQNTTDPQRKLELWAVYHKAHVMADVKRDGAGTDAESQRLHAARLAAATATAGEVDEERSFLYQRVAKTGKAFTAQDVDELIARKDAEHALEMKYGINFTTDGGARADGSHIHWGQTELATLDRTLGQMPADHRAAVSELHRQEHVYWGDPANKQEIGALATGTKVLLPDQAMSMNPVAQHRELADPAKGAQIPWLEWQSTHELGHIVSNKYSALEQKYEQINGWESYGQDTNALSAADKEHINAKRTHPFNDRNTIDKDGKTYEIDQSGPGYISYTQGAIPDTPSWSYAKTRGYEQFAEHYDQAIHTPETVYADLVTDPHAKTEQARRDLASATTLVDRQKAREQLALAEQAERVRRQSFDLMRNEVFGTDKAQAAAEARLQKNGADAKKLAAFRQRAAAASTPDQIAFLEKQH